MMTYITLESGQAIQCKICDYKSWNRNDVEKLYCGRCNVFHKDVERSVLSILQVAVGTNRQIWIDDANVILELLKDHPRRANLATRLGFLHNLVLSVAKKG